MNKQSQAVLAASPARMLHTARLLWPLVLLAVGVLFMLLLLLADSVAIWPLQSSRPLLFFFALAALLGLVLILKNLHGQLLKPLASLETAVAGVCQGEPQVSLPLATPGVLHNMTRDIDSLSEELTDLYEDMDTRVARATTRLAQKTASLRILYDVAAAINHSEDLNDLLLRFLRVLKELVDARSATVYVLGNDQEKRLIGCIDLQDQLVKEEALYPLTLCACGKALSAGDILCERGLEHCSKLDHRHMFSSDKIELLEVPIEYHNEIFGMYSLYVRKRAPGSRDEVLELLATIGSHLGIAAAKHRSDLEAQRLSIVQERTNLAHELHDSLAQTLASLRFQVSMLSDTLSQQCSNSSALNETKRLRNGLDEAHIELRELLNSFRAPVDRRGLIESLESTLLNFRQETGISAFFQNECHALSLNPNQEMHVLRIVQESLSNIRKHAGAHAVRVLLRCRKRNELTLLIEDDGVGFEKPPLAVYAGEHIGLSIMQERARSFGAELRIESEPGEGTRVEMLMSHTHKEEEAE
ncbi:MAG: histidine kinase [gamma proteobacterium symbiont of Bathyaustriella thionipta]|nr:histidine kinase [gamma proteobacterium symbiont of Bathyaustriella thionipta]